MSRRFRSDDTVRWKYKFGRGQNDVTISSNETVSWSGTRFQAEASFSGTAGNTTFTKPSGWSHQGMCLLIQTRGTGAGNYELQYIDFSGSSAVCDVPLQNTYATGGANVAQIITLSNGFTGYKNFTINSGVTYSANTWPTGGDTGGVVAILASGTITVNGQIMAGTKGFRGGPASDASDSDGKSGEGSGGASQTNVANPAGNGGGHNGAYSSGGGHAQTMSGGNGTEGSAIGNSQLTVLHFGGGGGGGASSHSGNGRGGNGGGIIFLIAKNIVIGGSGVLNVGGESGQSSPSQRSGSGGAAGSILLKAETINIGTNRLNLSGGLAPDPSGFSNNTVGSVGRAHADYGKSFSGSASPTTINTRLDKTITTLTSGGYLYTNFL